VPKGYTRVWNDGRHNPNRGLPQATSIVAPALAARVSTRTAPVAAPHQYVQVAAFANAGNANALGQRFMGMGLPVGLANSSRGKIVVLGPFASANALNRGLSAARAAGFSDAYTRN
jgi:cell division septation protein DedD